MKNWCISHPHSHFIFSQLCLSLITLCLWVWDLLFSPPFFFFWRYVILNILHTHRHTLSFLILTQEKYLPGIIFLSHNFWYLCIDIYRLKNNTITVNFRFSILSSVLFLIFNNDIVIYWSFKFLDYFFRFKSSIYSTHFTTCLSSLCYLESKLNSVF